MTPALDVAGLSAGYGSARVLHDVSLQVRVGEIVGLFGANGAGKTSLLRALSGALATHAGRVQLQGADITNLPPWQRVRAGLAHVPEGRHVFGAMTVLDNLIVASLSSTPGALDVADVLVLFPRLAERRRQLAGTLSGGEQQMLAIGRALVTGPSILLVDEMSAGLSPLLSQQLVEALLDIHRRGTAILLVEQSPHLVAHAVERVYLLECGRIVACGSLDELGGAEGIAGLYLGMSVG